MVREHQTADAQLRIGDLEIPGSMLRIAPERQHNKEEETS
jgi:hypothetical protein